VPEIARLGEEGLTELDTDLQPAAQQKIEPCDLTRESQTVPQSTRPGFVPRACNGLDASQLRGKISYNIWRKRPSKHLALLEPNTDSFAFLLVDSAYLLSRFYPFKSLAELQKRALLLFVAHLLKLLSDSKLLTLVEEMAYS